MSIKETLEIINVMEAEGVIDRYAIAGAVAAYNYIEPAVTDDLDILISFEETPHQAKTGLVTLAPHTLGRGDMMSIGKRDLSSRAGPFSSSRSLTISMQRHSLQHRRCKSKSTRPSGRCEPAFC